MAFSNTTTGATDRSSIVRGDVGLVSGTWQANGLNSGTVVTGGGTVLAFGLSVGSAGSQSGTAQIVLVEANVGGSKVQEYGSIGVTQIDVTQGVGGDWWAIVQV